VRDLRKCLAPVRLHDVGLRPPPSYVRLRQGAATRLSRACTGLAERGLMRLSAGERELTS
ncbi:MAG: hypothetical protein LM577_08815, partial [Thermoproteaceae archaeon]|nr:hypothetical protein [Thermoproteaceae archaeon]